MAFKRGLAYTGVAQPTPPDQVISDRSPTAKDYQSFNIGDRWIVPTSATAPSEQEWILMSKAQNQAVWVQVNAGGAVAYNDHELLVGTGTTTINTINTGNSGLALVSAGASADPAWGVLPVEGGGTGDDLWVPYAPILGGTTPTGALQSVASVGNSGEVLTSNGAGMPASFQAPGGGVLPVPSGGTGDTSILAYAVVTGGITDVDPLQTVGSLGTLNQVLCSNGAGALPSWKDNAANTGFSSIVVQTFTGDGTYTPTTNMLYCIVEALGGGGGAGGTGNGGGGSSICTTGGGGAGGYCRKVIDAATIGVSQVVTIGAGGAGATGNLTGTSGGSTTFGAILTAGGGSGSAGSASSLPVLGGAGGTASGGDINVSGQIGGISSAFSPAGAFTGSSGIGGNTLYGTGGQAIAIGNNNGNNGIGYGSGGSGSSTITAGGNKTGGTGASGLVIVTEFVGS